MGGKFCGGAEFFVKVRSGLRFFLSAYTLSGCRRLKKTIRIVQRLFIQTEN